VFLLLEDVKKKGGPQFLCFFDCGGEYPYTFQRLGMKANLRGGKKKVTGSPFCNTENTAPDCKRKKGMKKREGATPLSF